MPAEPSQLPSGGRGGPVLVTDASDAAAVVDRAAATPGAAIWVGRADAPELAAFREELSHVRRRLEEPDPPDARDASGP